MEADSRREAHPCRADARSKGASQRPQQAVQCYGANDYGDNEKAQYRRSRSQVIGCPCSLQKEVNQGSNPKEGHGEALDGASEV